MKNIPVGKIRFQLFSFSLSHPLAIFLASVAMANVAFADTELWTGVSGVSATTNWSDTANWSGTSHNPNNNDVKFYDTGATTLGTVNNVVDASTNCYTLTYGQTNSSHTTLIAAGKTLTIDGNSGGNSLIAGTADAAANAYTPVSMIIGAGGTLAMSGSSIGAIFVNEYGSGTGASSTLNMTNLDTFMANDGHATRLLVGVGGSSSTARGCGILYLARTNYITLTGTSPQIDVGDNTGNNGGGSTLNLGMTNVIFANTIAMGRTKQNTGGGGTIRFNPSFINDNPAAYFRGSDGASPVSTWVISDGLTSSGTITDSGTTDFSGGTVDALVTSMWIARNGTGANAGSSVNNGTLAMTAGTFVVVNLTNAMLASSAQTPTVTGNIRVNGGTLAVRNVFVLAALNGFTGTANSTLGITNGAVQANTIIAGGGNSIINITGGTLVVTNTAGTPASPIAALTATNATFQFSAVGGTTNMAVNALNLIVSNTVNIASVSLISAYPTQIPLVKYGSLPGGFNLTLGSLPGTFGGYISNDTVATIWLVITNGPALPKPIVWQGTVNDNDWNTSSLNWTNPADAGTLVSYSDNDFVIFDDSGPTNVVNLPATRSPGGITNNSTADYTFTGGGSLSGPAQLTKSGSGTLTLQETGGDNFSGGIAANAGTIVIDNNNSISGGTTIGASATVRVGSNDGNGNLPSGNVVNNGTLNLNRTNSYTVANAISGSGPLNIDPGNSNAVVTLGGASIGYTGPITVWNGTVQLNNNAAFGGTPTGTTNMIVITNGATLDVGGPGFAANGANLTNVWVYIGGSGVTSGSGAIINSSAVAQQNSLRHVVLIGDATVGGPGNFAGSGNPGRVDIRGSGDTLSTGGNAYNLTKIGSSQFSLVGATVDSALADIDVQGGQFAIETGVAGLGNPSADFILHAGANIELFNTFVSLTSFALNKNFIFYGNGVDTNVMVNSGGIYGTWSNVFVGPVTLTNGDVVMAGGTGNPCGVMFSNVVSGPGGFIVGGTRNNFTNYFVANNTYTGDTTIRIGTLALVGDGSISDSANIGVNGGATFSVVALTSLPYSIVSGQTLKGLTAGGTGNVAGAVTLDSGAALSLAYDGSIPTLTVSGGALTMNDNAVTVNVSGPALTEGSYKLISAGSGGSVAGSVASSPVTFSGSGASGYSGSLEILSGELYVVVGHAPAIANIVTNSVQSGLTWKISILSLSNSAAWSDADGETLTLSSVDSLSANSVSVSSDANYIYYNGPVTAEDHFGYTISDGTLTANGTVYLEAVDVASATHISNPSVDGSGHPTFSGHGIPGYTYGVEWASSLSGPWANAGQVTTDSEGAWSFTDTAQTNPGTIFYRLYYPYDAANPPQ